ncbi:MAG: hypothetical protein AAGA27_00560 [Pseudomonadota bacterium]
MNEKIISCLIALSVMASFSNSQAASNSSQSGNYIVVNSAQQLIDHIDRRFSDCQPGIHIVFDDAITLTANDLASYPIELCPNLTLSGKGEYSQLTFDDSGLPQGMTLFEVDQNDVIENMTINVPSDYNVIAIGNAPNDASETLGYLKVENVTSNNGLLKFLINNGGNTGTFEGEFVDNTINLGMQVTALDMVAGIEVTTDNHQTAYIDSISNNKISTNGEDEPGIFIRALDGGKIIFSKKDKQAGAIDFNTITSSSFGIYNFTSGGIIEYGGGMNNNLINSGGAEAAGIENYAENNGSQIIIKDGMSSNRIISLGGIYSPGIINRAGEYDNGRDSVKSSDLSNTALRPKIIISGNFTNNQVETAEFTDPADTENSNFLNQAFSGGMIDLSRAHIFDNTATEEISYYYDTSGQLVPDTDGNPEFSNEAGSNSVIKIGYGSAKKNDHYLRKHNNFVPPENAISNFVPVVSSGEGSIK